MNLADTIRTAKIQASQKITAALKELLEIKHLYQSVVVSFEHHKSLPPPKDSISGAAGFPAISISEIDKLINGPWEDSSKWIDGSDIGVVYGVSRLTFSVPDAKLFCRTCNRVEAFNYFSGYNIVESDGSVYDTTIQILALAYLCQSCKKIPEVFLIRREGNKLTLSGRTPIEHVEHTQIIPKSISKFFSGAIVAHQSGQTLAGVFLLRVLIEQWTQSQSETKGLRADKALDEYMQKLPIDFKERFPSVTKLYEKLSIDIHSATGSSDLFKDAQHQIVEHFEARRLFKLK